MKVLNKTKIIHIIILCSILCIVAGETTMGKTVVQRVARNYTDLINIGPLSYEQKCLLYYGSSYRFINALLHTTPDSSVILLPPTQMLRENRSDIPISATASGVYSLLYPRIPIHNDTRDKAPHKESVDYILIYNHWPLKQLDSTIVLTDSNRFGIFKLTQEGLNP